MKTLKDGLWIQGFLSKAWKHATGELPPPKPLEIHSADSNLGGLFPPGSPLLHRYDSHWPGAPFLLVPSDRHDEHYSNKPPSMRHFVAFRWYRRCGPAQGCTFNPHPLHWQATPPRPPRVSAGDASPLDRYQDTDSNGNNFPILPDYQKQCFKWMGNLERVRGGGGQSELTEEISAEPRGKVQRGALPPGK